MKPPALVIPLTPVAGAAHAFLAPSSADRWFRCPGSAWMESQFPDITDPTERAEGEAAHWVMQQVLITEIDPPSMIGVHAPNGAEITLQMIQAAEMLRDDIAEKLGTNWRAMVVVEKPLTVRRVHGSACWGTPDVRGWAQNRHGRWVLYVWDLKYGFKRVEVFENKQLVLYTIGAIEEVEAATKQPLDDQVLGVVLSVCQPRAYHPDGPLRSWSCVASDLRALVNQLAMSAEEATGEAVRCVPQPAACENCTARHACDALQEAAYRGMDIARQAVPRELSDEAAGLELVMLTDTQKLIDARVSGLEELVKHKLNAGARVPHWRMGPGRGSTDWTRPVEEILALGRIMGLDLAKPADAVTPLQAKAKGLPESLMKTYSEAKAGATKLTREDNSSVRRIFGR